MDENEKSKIPIPVINKKETESLDALTERYNKLIQPNKIAQFGTKARQLLPEKVKKIGNDISQNISEKELLSSNDQYNWKWI